MGRRKRHPEMETDTNEGELQVTARGREAKKLLQGRPDNGNGDEDSAERGRNRRNKIADLLNDPLNAVVVTRLFPRRVQDPANGEEVNVAFEVFRSACPVTLEDIKQAVFETHGGHKFQVRVQDGEGNPLGAIVIENSTTTEPKIPQSISEPPDVAAFMSEEEEPLDMVQKNLKKQVEVLTQRQTIEQLQDTLDSLKTKRERGGASTQDNETIRSLERKIDLMNQQREKDKLEAIIREQNAKLEALQKQMAAPPQGESMMAQLIREMREDRKASDARFERLMEQQRQDKMDAVLQEIKTIRNRPAQESGSLKENIETLKSIAEMLGWDLPGKHDDDDDRPKEWYEILLDKGIPMLEDLINDRKKQGKAMSKDEVISEMNKIADQAVKEELRRRQLAAQKTAQTLPAAAAGVPTVPQPAPAATPASVPTPVPVPGATAPVPPPLAVPPPAADPLIDPNVNPGLGGVPTVEQERAMRVGAMLTLLDRETELRPRVFEWNFYAWENVPEDLLEKMCAATNAVEMLSVFDGVVNAEPLARFKTKFQSGDARLTVWFMRGLKELQDWWAKSQADPNFDPADEEEEEEGEDQ